MSAFLRQKERLLGALRDEGGLFENRFLQRLLGRARAGVAASSQEADTIDATLATIRQEVHRDLAPGNATPGVLDRREAARLLRRLRALGHQTHPHARNLAQLL